MILSFEYKNEYVVLYHVTEYKVENGFLHIKREFESYPYTEERQYKIDYVDYIIVN